MPDDLTADEIEALDLMPRSVRLVLKRAYAKSAQKPLWIEGKNMRKAMLAAKGLGLVCVVQERGRYADQGEAVVLSPLGFRLAQHLRRLGWPNCEKPRSPE